MDLPPKKSVYREQNSIDAVVLLSIAGTRCIGVPIGKPKAKAVPGFYGFDLYSFVKNA
jgi:hypothetical protein